MIRALSLAAALAVLPITAAVAADDRTAAEAAIERAAASFEARMQAFGARAEAIAQDEGLSEAQREARIHALWAAEYAPDVAAFTLAVTEQAGGIAASALAGIDIEALVAEAMEGADIEAGIADALKETDIDREVARALSEAGIDGEVEKAVRVGGAMTAGGAWAQTDPEHAVTHGLVAQYALDRAFREANDDAGVETDD